MTFNQIIYINGPSSAGKTTLAKALQEALAEPYMHVSLDRIIGMMPEKINDWEGNEANLGFSWKQSIDSEGHLIHEIQTGPFAKKCVETFVEIVKTMAGLGHYLIIDDVSFGKKQVDIWRHALKAYKVLWVGLSAPSNVLDAREESRSGRIKGSARAQSAKVHTEVIYDLAFDTGTVSIDHIVQVIKKVTHQKS